MHDLRTLPYVGGWPETKFLSELARCTGCGMLVAVDNVLMLVSATNLGFSAQVCPLAFAAHAVGEIQRVGYTADPALGSQRLVDSHDAAIDARVWALHEWLISRAGARPTSIERDGSVPKFAASMQECGLAHAV